MSYTIEDLKNKIIPVAKKHHLSKVYLFGSYARNEADDQSDVDLAVEESTNDYYAVYLDYQNVFDKVDVVPIETLLNPTTNVGKLVKENFLKERVLLYEAG